MGGSSVGNGMTGLRRVLCLRTAGARQLFRWAVTALFGGVEAGENRVVFRQLEAVLNNGAAALV